MSKPFYQLSISETYAELDSNPNGLNKQQLKERLDKYGPNKIPQPKAKTVWHIFFSQFLDPLIYVLIGAAIISLFTGELSDAIFITAIVVINAILGTYQEWRAENSAQALKNMVVQHCRVRRDGHIREIESEDLVPGDIVLLESGVKSPADMRLVQADDLSLEEALLTGESIAVSKNTDALTDHEGESIGDRINMVFAATTVQKGRGTGIVTATGEHTEIGKIADSLRTTEAEKPPLEKRMEAFSKKISIIVVILCVILGVIGYFRGMEAAEIFFLMVAVGVAAIPEGLPVALTVALSIGTRRMAKRHVIVRKLPAVEGLGSCTLIASDKTGTLTMDQQSIQKLYLPNEGYYEITGEGYNGNGQIKNADRVVKEPSDQLDAFLTASIMANEGILRKTHDGWEHSGDAVDVAFRALTYKAGLSPTHYKEAAEVKKLIPYESEQKYSAAFYQQNGQLFYAMKGAVEVVLEHLPEANREAIKEESDAMAADGYRVLALAGNSVETEDETSLPALELMGLIGMIDPLRPEAKDAVKDCHDAGIDVVMITGDHPATALAIAKSLGIASNKEEIISGAALSKYDEAPASEFASKIDGKKVFARVAPLQKKKIVDALKELGHFVAVTGDGANDAPALKSAHIGVAMGAGTDLAKEASSILITDNNFASIAAGVEEGRFTFDNLRKIIYMVISTGAAELITVAVAIIVGWPSPFLAVQLLWLNLVTNGIQEISLAFEKGDPAVMQQPPRKPDESIFNRLMNSQMIVSGVAISAVVMGVWYYLTSKPGYNLEHARTVVVMLMVLIQNFHVLNCRSETKSLFHLPLSNNYTLLIGVVVAQLVHISAAYIPGLNSTLQLEPITWQEWLILLPAAASILLVMEIFKWIMRKGMTSKQET